MDWDLQIDLDKQLKFPDHVTLIEEANERKRSKYQDLVGQCQR